MKILYHHRIASKDGQYIHLSAIVRALEKRGHEVILCGPDIAEAGQMGGGKAWVAWLKEHIPSVAYELIECVYNIYDFIRVCFFLVKYQPDVIYERYNLYFVSGVWAKTLFNKPLLLEVNAPLYQERKRFNHIALDQLARWTEHYVWKNADIVLPVTEVLAEIIQNEVKPKAIEVIHNGVFLEELVVRRSSDVLRQQYGLHDETILGFVGFVRDWHRLDQVIDYIAKNKDKNLVLMIVGEGPDCARLVQHAIKAQIEDKVIMVGVVQREEMASYINVFDVALQSAVTEYASPLKLFEYLALGKIIVAPDMPNIREILADKLNGVLFDAVSTNGLAEALDTALSVVNRADISTSAKEAILQRRFLWHENAKRIEVLFRSKLGGMRDEYN